MAKITYPTDYSTGTPIKVEDESTAAAFDPAQFGIAKDQKWEQEYEGYTRTWTVMAVRPGRVQMRLTGLAVKNVHAVTDMPTSTGIRIKVVCPFVLAFNYKKVS